MIVSVGNFSFLHSYSVESWVESRLYIISSLDVKANSYRVSISKMQPFLVNVEIV